MLRHHESRVEADAELADDIGGALRFLLHGFDESFGARFGDGAQAGDDLIAIHADAAVADRQRVGVFIQRDPYRQLGFGINHVVVGQHLELQPIQSIRGVGDQLAQEDLLLGIKRVDQDVQQLLGFGLKCVLFAHAPSLPRVRRRSR